MGARTYYILFHFGSFGLNPFKWLLIFHFPGLSFIGGFLAALLAGYFFSRKTKVSFWQIGDFLAPGFSLGEAVARIGAFLSGSGYGIETNLFLGLPVIGVLGKRHPVQIYEGLASLLIFIFLILLKRKLQSKKFSPGILFSGYLFLFGLTKFFLEFFRGEVVYLGGWRLTQIIALALVLVSPALFFKRLGKTLRGEATAVWQAVLNKFKAAKF
jgi:phosphatidylglycerol:prolipoprotein diacylglycerol transferase